MRARRRALAGRAHGRVLDLGGASAHDALWDPGAADLDVLRLAGPSDPEIDRLAASERRFDTVFSVFQLVAAVDLRATLAQIRGVLDADGVVLFLEPARLVGVAGRTQRLLGPAVAATAGWHLDRDVPMELRRAGLSVTDLERHRTRTTQWWLRTLVEGTAHHSLVPPRG